MPIGPLSRATPKHGDGAGTLGIFVPIDSLEPQMAYGENSPRLPSTIPQRG
jgi:hypothetical protein